MSASLNPTLTLQVSSPHLSDLLEQVGQQVVSLFIDPHDISPALREKVSIEAKNPEALLNEWVNMVLELLRTHHLVIHQFKIDLKIDTNENFILKSEALGELLDVQRHSLQQNPALLRCQKARLDLKGGLYFAEIVLTA